MRVSINTGSPKDLKELFKFEQDYLDFYITRDSVYIIASKPDSYVHKEFVVTSRHNFFEEQSLRIERKDFLSLALEGSLTIQILAGEVEFSFVTEETSFTLTRKHQKSDLASILSKMDVLSKSANFIKVDLSPLKRFMSLLGSFSPITNVQDNMVIADNGSVQLYCKTTSPNLSALTGSLNYLLQKSDNIYMYQKYIIGFSEGVTIMISQTRQSIESSFSYIEGRPSSHMLKVDLGNVILLSKRVKGNSMITIDANKSFAELKGERIVLGTKFKVHQIQTAKDKMNSDGTKNPLEGLSLDLDISVNTSKLSLIPIIQVPSKLFSSFLSYQEKKSVNIYIKKSFFLIRPSKDVYFVVGRNKNV